MSPQGRGKELQKLFARMVEQHGWLQEEGVKTSNEEIDVIIHRDREYYLVECKWEKGPIEAKVIREFHGKLTKRADVRGIVVSMAGFTSGAEEEVRNYTGSRIILLFGKIDTENMIFNRVEFEELLNEKYKNIITRRQVVFQ
jgi:predicted Mrr-cat superfamily restriction endonuclease